MNRRNFMRGLVAATSLVALGQRRKAVGVEEDIGPLMSYELDLHYEGWMETVRWSTDYEWSAPRDIFVSREAVKLIGDGPSSYGIWIYKDGGA